VVVIVVVVIVAGLGKYSFISLASSLERVSSGYIKSGRRWRVRFRGNEIREGARGWDGLLVNAVADAGAIAAIDQERHIGVYAVFIE
jgi:hypothetical protein